MINKFVQHIKFFLKQYNRAFQIGYSAGSGNNVYLTFGSPKTVTKDAEDSFNRYSMAMRQYNQKICNKETFVQGYNEAKRDKSFR